MSELFSAESMSSMTIRDVRCKDCLRERARGSLDEDAPKTERDEHFEYNEVWAQRLLDRGGSRTDRCARHRRLHIQAIQGLAVAYIDLQTVGEVTNRENPIGPLGGLGPLPDLHTPIMMEPEIPFSNFGMTDVDIRDIFQKLSNPNKRVLVLKAGTGTGKSTFAPFRLLCPPDGVDFSLTKYGPIVVTEPRVQATIGVARYVGERLVMGCLLKECNRHGPFNPRAHRGDELGRAGTSCTTTDCRLEHVGDHPGPEDADCIVSDCARHIGPGYRVGYQVAGDKNHDDACQLVYVTDGTMINWLREGRLNKIGTVIVDEAHERSTNIDFILGYLRREINRYPHLRVIVTSATFDVDFYLDYFGGSEKVETKIVLAAKTFGYGAPLFPVSEKGDRFQCGCEPVASEPGGELTMPHPPVSDFKTWRALHWPKRPDSELTDSTEEDVWETTAKLEDLRFPRFIPKDNNNWVREMPRAVADHVITLVRAFDERSIFGDILAFLPNNNMIDVAITRIRQAISPDDADVFALIQSAPTDQKEAALAARPRGSKRKIVVSTNLAETSLTVSGVRFVVDSGLTTQGAWNPALATKTVPTGEHSRAGLRQRWGRVGRDAPGWVFPLYTREQFDSLTPDTPPGSTRDNLEQLVMKAKAGGIDDVADFPWPARHIVSGTKRDDLDPRVRGSMDVFDQELSRAAVALVTNGILDGAPEGHLTSYGKEMERFGQHSASFAMATMFADQLACVPEVVTGLILLEDQKPQGYENVDLRNLPLINVRPFNGEGPYEWQVLADQRWQQLQVGCRDDLDLVLRIVRLWEQADPERKPWEPSPKRKAWADQWWLNHEVLLKAAELRRAVLESLSPAMKEEVKRFIEPRLVPRARAVITRAFVAMRYQQNADYLYLSTRRPDDSPASISGLCRLEPPPSDLIALNRELDRSTKSPVIRNLVQVTPWAADQGLGSDKLLMLCAANCRPSDLDRASVDSLLHTITTFPVGAHLQLQLDTHDQRVRAVRSVRVPFAYPGEPDTSGSAEDEDALPELTEAGHDEGVGGQTGWPTGNHKPQDDEDAIERLRLNEPDTDIRDESTGRSLGLEANDFDDDDPSVPNGRLVDVLAEMNARRSTDDQVRYVFTEEGVTPPEIGWYRCAGYQFQSEEPTVLLEPLADAEIEPSDPAVHADLEVGKFVKVAVGGTLALQGRMLRVLYRIDGEGRFLLGAGRPGTGNPPVSLDLFHQHVVDSLETGAQFSVMVVPTKYGTHGVTLVPLLSEHLDERAVKWPPAVSEAASQGTRRPYWNALVVGVPNQNGFATVEILERDRNLGVTHRFGVAVKPDDSSFDLLGQLDMPVKISLRRNTSVRLYGDRDALESVVEQYDKAISLSEGDDRRWYISPRGPLSPAVRDVLVELDRSRSWTATVWDFYLQSHMRRDGPVEPGTEVQPIHVALPSPPAPVEAYAVFQQGMVVQGIVDDLSERGLQVAFRGGATGLLASRLLGGAVYRLGDEVVCRVRAVVAASRLLTLELGGSITVEAEAPPWWMSALIYRQDELGTRLRVGVSARDLHIELPVESPEEATRLAGELRSLLSSPAALVEVADRIGLVSGAGGKNLIAAKETPRVWVCDFLAGMGELAVVAESNAELVACLEKVLAPVRTVSGRMRVPNGRSGPLLGKGGEAVRQMKRDSGCFGADAGPEGPRSPEWSLEARSLDAIESFVREANLRVPGCTLEQVEVVEPQVTDGVVDEQLRDWRTHKFASAETLFSVEIRTPDVVDLRPDGGSLDQKKSQANTSRHGVEEFSASGSNSLPSSSWASRPSSGPGTPPVLTLESSPPPASGTWRSRPDNSGTDPQEPPQARSLVVEAKSLEEALEFACGDFGVTLDHLTWEVLTSKPEVRLFGMIKHDRQVRVRIALR